MSDQVTADVLGLTAQIVSAHVANNKLGTEALPDLIQSVYRSLSTVGQPDVSAADADPVPAVPIKKSVFPDFIVCLEDGRKLKMLKRHLHTSYGMTPEQYRTKWGLPTTYPMTAPSYASRRSDLAKESGLGRMAQGTTKRHAASASDADPAGTKISARRGRRPKG